ncbi:MAG: MauE/DoxX family redox-associated membrane protein [Isosphaeraceae bacterium]
MTAVGWLVAWALGSVLLGAGLSKLADPGGFASTLEALGAPGWWARRFAVALPLAEVLAGLGVLFAPHWGPSRGAVAVLGCGFAAAGVAGLRSRREIRCHCFGPAAIGGRLGAAQVAALPAYLGGAWLLGRAFPGPPPPAWGASLFAASGLALAAIRVVAVRGAFVEARGDRLSAEEMYLWLPRH